MPRTYRGRGIYPKEWVYGYLIGDDVIVGNIVEFNDEYFNTSFWYKVEPKTVGENTGLRDKNGKGREMYEGDVYKHDNRYYVIEWYETTCAYVIRSLTSGSILPGHLTGEVAIYNDYEYVGSIHEHPELLEREGRT